MATFILIRGTQNEGKSTTAGMVYQRLLKGAQPTHLFNGSKVDQDSLVIDADGNTHDFWAVLTINGKLVAVASAGDVASQVRVVINIFIEMKVDVIICCTRTYNKVGSTYRLLLTEYANTHPIEAEIFTRHSDAREYRYAVKEPIVDKIVSNVETLTRAKDLVS